MLSIYCYIIAKNTHKNSYHLQMIAVFALNTCGKAIICFVDVQIASEHDKTISKDAIYYQQRCYILSAKMPYSINTDAL